MATTRLITIEEFERMPLEGRYELIDGEVVEMSPSSGESGTISAAFVFFLMAHVRPRGLGRVYTAEAGFALFPGRQLVRAPDAAFVRADRLPPLREQDHVLRLVPDLVVEVISPTDREADVLAKVQMYLEAGVRLVWVADPPRRTVTVYAPGRESRVVTVAGELDGGEVLPEFRVAVAELFA